MARLPSWSFGDVDARVTEYLAHLASEGLAARMSSEQVAEQVTLVRSLIDEASDEGPAEMRVATIERTRFRHVEQVSVTSSGLMHSIPPVLDEDGRIDVEASVLNLRLIRKATTPDITPDSVPLRARVVLAVLRWRMRHQVGELADIDEAIDASMREALTRARSED